MLGCSLSAWDPSGSGQTPGGCSGSRGGREGAGQEEGSAWRKLLFCLCPVPLLSQDMDNSGTRPPSRARHGTLVWHKERGCRASPAGPVQASVHVGARKTSPDVPTLWQLQAASTLGDTRRGEVPGFGLEAASSRQVPSRAVLRSPLRPLSLSAHLHDVLNYGGPSGELVGLLADPLLPLRLAPAAQGGLGRKSRGTP